MLYVCKQVYRERTVVFCVLICQSYFDDFDFDDFLSFALGCGDSSLDAFSLFFFLLTGLSASLSFCFPLDLGDFLSSCSSKFFSSSWRDGITRLLAWKLCVLYADQCFIVISFTRRFICSLFCIKNSLLFQPLVDFPEHCES